MNDDIRLDIQGHRGCRGLMPENTIPAFKKAIDLGVTTLELDVVANKFGDVFISHEPFFNHEIATAPDENNISKDNEKQHNMYELTAGEIRKYDVGIKPHPKFPKQNKIAISKPLLSEMVEELEVYAKSQRTPPPLYNIEIKRVKDHDNIYHPTMKDFADLVYQEIKRLGILERTTVQCFDVETLQYLKESYPEVRLVYLVYNTGGYKKHMDDLGFIPYIYSPYYELVNQELVDRCNHDGVILIPWTVNEKADMKHLIGLGVHGIISDYPDVLIEVVKELSNK